MSPDPPVPRRTLVDDRYADARMRALIPRFAVLGCLATLLLAPSVAPSPRRAAGICANVAVALAVTAAAYRFRLVERAAHWQLYLLLLLYGALISVGTGIAGADVPAYVLLQALPVLFGAVFFVGPDRYLLPVGLAAVEYGVLRAFGPFPLRLAWAHLVLFLLVAHFGDHVSRVLRNAVNTTRALHRVLEVASGDPPDSALAGSGLAAALSTVDWQGGAVILRDGTLLAVAAAAGVSPEVPVAYAERPMRLGDGSMSATIVSTGEPMFVGDVPAFLGADHALARDGVRCMAGVPICYHGDVIGVLIVNSRRPRRRSAVELDRLLVVAEQIGLAIGNARAHRREAEVASELRELNRRKDQFLANTSHELRTPATTLALAARTLRYGGDRVSEEDKEYAYDTIHRRAMELTTLVESLLEESLADSGVLRLSPMPLEWTAAVRRWAVAASQRAGRSITVEVPDEPVVTEVDPGKVERIVGHLLANAAKYSPPDVPIRCRLSADGASVELTVTDEGIGIAPEHHERVFERFYQVDGTATRPQGGCGIGLSLVRHYAVAHGGTVELASALGEGTTVTVRFPRASTTAVPHRPASGVAAG